MAIRLTSIDDRLRPSIWSMSPRTRASSPSGLEEITASLSLRIRALSVPHRRGTQHVVCAVLRRCGPVSGSAHWVLSHERRAPLSGIVAGVAPSSGLADPN
jgi:hypothetical protein